MTREERQAAILAGAGLVATGSSIAQAARETGLPYATLHRGIEQLSRDADTLKAGADQQAAASLIIAAKAAELVYAGLESATYDQQLRAYGIATDKVATYAGWGRDREAASGTSTSDALAKLADAIAGGGSVTLTVVPAQPAIDVTPKVGDGE